MVLVSFLWDDSEKGKFGQFALQEKFSPHPLPLQGQSPSDANLPPHFSPLETLIAPKPQSVLNPSSSLVRLDKALLSSLPEEPLKNPSGLGLN